MGMHIHEPRSNISALDIVLYDFIVSKNLLVIRSLVNSFNETLGKDNVYSVGNESLAVE
jgi:hypothetical protein